MCSFVKFNGFNEEDFFIFQYATLDERMSSIRQLLQPKFQEIGTYLVDSLNKKANKKLYLHIARHARRKVNPPKHTWLAISHHSRGYKMTPYFQVGLFDDHVFVWLAFIYELPSKSVVGETFLNHIDEIEKIIPSHYYISQNHNRKEAMLASEVDLEDVLYQFKTITKSEFNVGLKIMSDDPILKDGSKLLHVIEETFTTLLPIYSLATESIDLSSVY